MRRNVLGACVRGSPAEQGLAGLPELRIPGLPVEAARALLGSAVPGPLDPRETMEETGPRRVRNARQEASMEQVVGVERPNMLTRAFFTYLP